MPEEKSLPKPQTDLPLPEKELTSSEPQTGQSNVVVKNEKPGGKSPTLKFVLLGVLFVIGLSLIAGAYVLATQKSNQQSVQTQITKSPSPTPDPLIGYKLYSNQNLGVSFKIPETYCVIKESITEVQFNIQELDGTCNPDVYLSVSKNLTNLSSYPDCSINENKNYENRKECIDKKDDINLDGVNTKIYGLDLGVDNGYYIYQISNPALEIKMFVTGAGLNETLQNIISTFKFTDSDSVSDTSGWKNHSNNKFGYSIMYPSNTNGENWVWEEFDDDFGTGFGPLSSKSGGYRWVVTVFSDKSVFDQLTSETGRQFNDRKETKSSVNVNGYPATISTVTTAKNPEWIAKRVYIENKGKIYVISNGAVDDPDFENFYKSFKLN